MKTQNAADLARQPAAGTAKAATTQKVAKEPKGPSKMEQAYKLVEANFQAAEGSRLSRTAMINKIASETGMSVVGAGTYYHNSTVKYKKDHNVEILPSLPRAATAVAK